MSTNYYLCVEPCAHCHREFPKLHIGKFSGGWSFSFRGHKDHHPPLTTYEEWFNYLADETADGHCCIKDEYDEMLSVDEFQRMVESAKVRKNYTVYCRKTHPEYAKDCWVDEEGHSFTGTEFS